MEQVDRLLDHLLEPSSELARERDLDHDRHVFQRLLAMIRPDFREATWQEFRTFVIDGVPAPEAAGNLGLSELSVLQAKSRILKRLREEAGELLY
jgi:RNA polymerase sigma-70 factor (ECF subfamily)